MIPIVTPAEMAAIDAAAPEPVEVLIERAGGAVARAALRQLGGGYGRRAVVVAGRGNNGNDGRSAARRLGRRGVRCVVITPGEAVPQGADLVIDAAYGTGFVARPGWRPPTVGAVPVLAVDIPSGVSGLTGEAVPGVPAALATVTFAALKPGLVLHPGRGLAGTIEVADIGLDCSAARAWDVEAADVADWLAPRPSDSHKWKAACWLIAGSPTMTGAAALAARGCARAGAGYVRLSMLPASPVSPAGVSGGPNPAVMPAEVVHQPLPAGPWAETALAQTGRFAAVVVGPGLGRSPEGDVEVRRFIAGCAQPLVVDGDGLSALEGRAGEILRARQAPTVVTPHDGEFERLAGHRPGSDRLEEARNLARATSAVVLLKGPTTVVAAPDGTVLVSRVGDARLATAGSGDVLAGIIGALLARGVPAQRAAAAGAFIHGAAAQLGPPEGLVAGDLPELLPAAWREMRAAR